MKYKTRTFLSQLKQKYDKKTLFKSFFLFFLIFVLARAVVGTALRGFVQYICHNRIPMDDDPRRCSLSAIGTEISERLTLPGAGAHEAATGNSTSVLRPISQRLPKHKSAGLSPGSFPPTKINFVTFLFFLILSY